MKQNPGSKAFNVMNFINYVMQAGLLIFLHILRQIFAESGFLHKIFTRHLEQLFPIF